MNDDCISRAEALGYAEYDERFRLVIPADRVCRLPSVPPQVAHGRWIDIETVQYGTTYATCSRCNYRCARDTVMGKVSEQFCKDCGAKMGGEDDAAR